MKKIFSFFAVLIAAISVFAQDYSDEDLFGSPDDAYFGDFSDSDFFGDDTDSFFFDDGIEELEDTSAKTDLSKGVLFENGSIKIGGNLTASIGTNTVLYNDEKKTFSERLSESLLTPTLSANLSVDARPNQNLRVYTKFGFAYPFKQNVQMSMNSFDNSIDIDDITTGNFDFSSLFNQMPEINITDWFKLKELFTDFSIADTAFFRFGLHTVTWGTGYFYSPVSDMINTSSINPEDVTAQVDGSLNLRTQITFPNTQNCLWLYVIPSTDFIAGSAASYTKKTGFAGKYEFVVGGWEIGAGAYWRWEDSPKAMLTASGSIKNLNVFAEGVYSFGGSSEWKEDQSVNGKTSIFQGTIGGLYYWKNPGISLAAQYYFDGNKVDKMMNFSVKDGTSQYAVQLPRITQGHNIAVMTSFSKLFGNPDLNAVVLALANFGREEINSDTKQVLENANLDQMLSIFNCATFAATLTYTPVSAITISAGPYISVKSFDETPSVALKIDFKLGGGKF